LTKKEADATEIERALLRALDADPTHRPTLAALEKMARDVKDDERLVQILELGLEVASDDDERRRLLREVAGLYTGSLGHPAAVAALGRLAFRAGDLEGARKYYRSLLLQNFDEKTAGVSKAEVYLMLGRMHVLANEIPKARNMFERGLEVDPGNVDLKAAIA